MLHCATLFALLVLTWTQQAGSTMCGDKCESKEHGELHSLLKKTEAAISNILHSEEHKKILHDITKKMKSKICELNLDAKALSKITKISEDFLKEIQNGSLNEKFFINFLTNDPMKQIDSMMKKVLENVDK